MVVAGYRALRIDSDRDWRVSKGYPGLTIARACDLLVRSDSIVMSPYVLTIIDDVSLYGFPKRI